jgi:multimeric flavodoxin WrbA
MPGPDGDSALPWRLVLAGPIWLGDNSSVMKRVIERLYACSHLLSDAGQYAYYGRVGGCLITGNEDGIRHGNQRSEWEAGCRFDYGNPDYR